MRVTAEGVAVHVLARPYRCGHCQTGHHGRCLVVYREASMQTVKVAGKRDTLTVRVDVTCACAAADPDGHQKQEVAA